MSLTQQQNITSIFMRECKNTGYSLVLVNFKKCTAVIERVFGGDIDRRFASLSSNGRMTKMNIGDLIPNEEFDNFLSNYE